MARSRAAPATTGTDRLPPATSTGRRTAPASAASRCATSTGCAAAGSDRYIAGVAGGLGRHFDVDPTVIRVLLAVLTFFGGAGVLVYGVVWLFVPEDGEDRAPVELNPDILKIVLIVTAAIALMIVFGSPFFNDSWGWGFPLPARSSSAWSWSRLRHPRPAPPRRPGPARAVGHRAPDRRPRRRPPTPGARPRKEPP